MARNSRLGSEHSGNYNPIKYSNVAMPLAEPMFKIIDKKSQNHFGILLFSQKALENFQINSGMRKPYKVEYQFHYHAFVARVQFEEDTLDIAVPTVLFNYKQTVSGASVDFNLVDVEKASQESQQLADATANTLVGSQFGETIKSIFPNVQWLSVSMNTCHVHPGQLSSFSGTDYDKNPNNAGIVFPLQKANNQSSFSSILCHDNNDVVKLVRTEYRNATSDENQITYSHGSCFTHVQGYSRQLRLLQQIFANKQSIDYSSYIHVDGYVNHENNEIIQKITDAFDALDFVADTSHVKAENIVYTKPVTKVIHPKQEPKVTFGKNSKKKSRDISTLDLKTESLFSDDPLYSNYDKVAHMQEECILAGFAASQVYSWPFQKLQQFYNSIKPINDMITSSKDMSIEELIKELLENYIDPSEIKGKSVAELQEMYDELMDDLNFQENAYEIIPNPALQSSVFEWKKDKKAMKFLLDFGFDKDELDSMTEEQVEMTLTQLNY